MAGIDESRSFVPLEIAILTISDSRTLETDGSGATLAARVERAGHRLALRSIVTDDQRAIEARLKELVVSRDVDVVIATGGTGITGRDVTPEAFRAICQKELPGFGELFRSISLRKIGLAAIQSRALAGVADGTLLFAIPGSTGACEDAWDEILVYQLDSRYRPCNFVDLMPRLRE